MIIELWSYWIYPKKKKKELWSYWQWETVDELIICLKQLSNFWNDEKRQKEIDLWPYRNWPFWSSRWSSQQCPFIFSLCSSLINCIFGIVHYKWLLINCISGLLHWKLLLSGIYIWHYLWTLLKYKPYLLLILKSKFHQVYILHFCELSIFLLKIHFFNSK